MKALALPEIKKELKILSKQDIETLCLRLARFKKENKELLTYLLFESHNENGYIETIKTYMDEEFNLINTNSYFYIKKSIRKILKNTKKYIRYSQKKETEVELLIYFCKKLKNFKPSIKSNTQLLNMYNRQIALAKKTIDKLHEDLQHDYNVMLKTL